MSVWKIFKQWLAKKACCHDWVIAKEVGTYEYSYSKRPYKIIYLLKCTKCGKLKKVNL